MYSLVQSIYVEIVKSFIPLLVVHTAPNRDCTYVWS